MRRTLAGGLELDDDPARVDVEEVTRFLREESYWAQGRGVEQQRTLVENATLVVGLYSGRRQIGFARAVSDGVSFAYLADVYVHRDFRGRGLGVELVRAIVAEGPLAGLRWLLQTRDAQGLYRKVGFGIPEAESMERRPPEPA